MCEYCSWIEKIRTEHYLRKEKVEKKIEDATLVVHATARTYESEQLQLVIHALKRYAVRAYRKATTECCSSLDVCEIAIRRLEKKRKLKYPKCSSMDAALMTSKENCGSVGGVRNAKHPISLARCVMEKTNHVVIVGKGVEELAKSFGLEENVSEASEYNGSMDVEYCTNRLSECSSATDSDDVSLDKDSKDNKNLPQCVERKLDAKRELKRAKEFEKTFAKTAITGVSTFGCVAYDQKHQMTSGNSIAIEKKLVGSVTSLGTVPGCGVYASKRGCASVSGNDKKIYGWALARRVVENMNDCKCTDMCSCMEDSICRELKLYAKETKETNVGAVAINANGLPAVVFKSQHFPWAYCKQGVLHYGAARGEHNHEKIEDVKIAPVCPCADNYL